MPNARRRPQLPNADSEDFYRMLDGIVIDDTGLFNERLSERENFYNFQ